MNTTIHMHYLRHNISFRRIEQDMSVNSTMQLITAHHITERHTDCCHKSERQSIHYSDVILGTMVTQITSLTTVYCLSRCRSKKTSKLCVTGLCEGNSPGTGEFPAQMASNAENVSIWGRHHAISLKHSQIGKARNYTHGARRVVLCRDVA